MARTKRRILVVDDESPIADLLAEFCESFGFETKILNGGEAVMDVVRSFQPDLITLDLVMPDVSGLEVLELLHQDLETRSIPVVVISSIAGNASVVDILQKKARSVLAKPVQMHVLRTAIDEILSPAREE